MITRWMVSLGLICMLGFPKPLAQGTGRLLQQVNPTQTPALTLATAILAPLEGQAVQGRVPVLANTAVQGFQSAELYFGYAADSTGTWFLIGQYLEPAAGTEAGTWDTSLITDGNYNLRLVVFLADGTQLETLVRGLRVRNYSPVETDTPTPVIPTNTPLPGELPTLTATALPTFTPTPTPLPTNPAEMTTAQITGSLGKGALAVAAIFILLGLYGLISMNRRKKSSFDDGTD
jgi:hypothetical protein